MNGEILQLIALCCHANATLRARRVPEPLPKNAAFDFCEFVRFVRPARTLFGGVKDRTFASTPQEWLGALVADGVVRVRLARASGNDPAAADRTLAAFIGGAGTWYLELLRADGQSDFLLADGQVHNLRAPDGRIWRTTYKQVSGPSTNSSPIPIAQATANLKAALDDVAAFALKQNLSNWHANFMSALDAFDASKPARFDNCADLAPPGVLPLDARTLLDACQRAWVFGGMGSWNDLGFDEPHQAEYDRVSEQLYQCIVAGILAATNASAPHHVAIVLDTEFGAKLRSLAAQLHVWAINSPTNKPVIEELWTASTSHSPARSVTAFPSPSTGQAEASFIALLADIDAHHTQSNQNPSWSALHCFGIAPTPTVREALETYGVDQILQCKNHFLAMRAEPPD